VLSPTAVRNDTWLFPCGDVGVSPYAVWHPVPSEQFAPAPVSLQFSGPYGFPTLSRCTGWLLVDIRVAGVVSPVPVSWHAPQTYDVLSHLGEVAEPFHPAFSNAFPPWQYSPAHTAVGPVPPTPTVPFAGSARMPLYRGPFAFTAFHVLSNRTFTNE